MKCLVRLLNRGPWFTAELIEIIEMQNDVLNRTLGLVEMCDDSGGFYKASEVIKVKKHSRVSLSETESKLKQLLDFNVFKPVNKRRMIWKK